MKTAEQAAQAYQAAMASGITSQRYKEGVQGVTESPMAKAASVDATQRYLNGIQNAVSSGKRQAALNAVPLQRWKDNAANKGAQRLASGAQAASDKIRQHFVKWTPIYNQVSDTVRAMPKGGLANAQARANAAIQMLMQAAGSA